MCRSGATYEYRTSAAWRDGPVTNEAAIITGLRVALEALLAMKGTHAGLDRRATEVEAALAAIYAAPRCETKHDEGALQRALFAFGDFSLHSGQRSRWKIDCDQLSDPDLDTLALLVVGRCGDYRIAIGVPCGGIRFARALNAITRPPPWPGISGPTLLVDDVLTTGASMEELRREHPEARGVVIFARGPCPDWITPIFRVEERFWC